MIYIYTQTDSGRVELTRWGSLTLAPIIGAEQSANVFSTKFTETRKFSPSKPFRYTYTILLLLCHAQYIVRSCEYIRILKPSQQISAPLVDRIINQDHQLDDCHSVQQSIKRRIQHMKYMKQKEDAKNLQRNLPNPLQRSIELSQEKGASTWLTALPINEHGFALHKAAFRDSLSLRYGWPLQNSPSHCSCGQPFSVEHALTCKTGGFPAVRHNEVRDITATLLTEVCHGVTTEPHLQPLSGESLSHRSAITEDGARLDVAMYGFWGGRFEKAFVDVRVFNPSAQSNRHGPLSSVYRKHEQEKRRHYD